MNIGFLSWFILMPYFIYKILPGASQLVKSLELVGQFDAYQDAKQSVKQLRIEQAQSDEVTYKIVFAENSLEAEELLQERREAPILQEWEK